MTGSLIIRAASPYFNLDRPVVAATSNTIVGSIADKARWGINLGDSVAETGSNTGTNFSVSRFNDDGSFLDVPLVISRTTGNVAFKSNVTAGAGSSAASYSFGAAGVKYLGYDGTNFNFVGGAAILTPMLNVTGGVMFDISKDLGFRAYEGGVNQRYYSYSATYYMHWDGNNGDYRIVLNNAERLRISNASGNVSISGAIQSDNGRIISHGGAPSIVVFDGGSAQGFWMGPSILYFGSATGDGGPAVTWGSLSAGALVAYNDGQKPGGGPWTALSDARIKNVESDYTQSLAEIIQLNPVNYTYKGNDTPVAPTHALDAPPTKDEPTVPYPNSAHYSAATEQKKFVGLVAQEVKAIFPEMVKLSDGYIDGQPVTDLHNLDTTPLIFALVNAIKELNARIEALEAQ
jgi:hypothetical protein